MGEIEQAMVWGTVAYAAAQNLSPDALEFYNMSARLTPANIKVLSPLSFEWRARMALRTNNWALVKTYIEEMPNFVRKRDNTTGYLSTVWDYWLARAYAERGDKLGAERIYREISQKTDFYGQLSTEELGKLITIPNSVMVTQEEIAKISHRKGIQQSKRFFDMNMRDEGRREWNWETRFMNDKELIAMAEIGVRLDMMDRAIYSADKTKEQHNFQLRYPTPMLDVLRSAADKAKVDLAFVYGLTRQESRFIKSAKSGVGASGLMQVMPATGAWVAKKIGMSWPSSKAEAREKLADMNTNTTLGAAYVGMVLADLDYHYGMAAAAYNAGPSRPKKWRAMLTQGIDGAAYAESIPFAETRDYVKNVLSNTVYYRGLMSGQPQSLKNLVATIAPKEDIPSDLP
jgi:soluble lytic murein transglycosylase